MRSFRHHTDGEPRQRSCLALAAAVLVAGLAGCSAERAKPDAAARALAEGLSSLDLNAVAFTDITAAQANRELSAAVDGMGELRPSVRVQSTQVGKDKATATAVFSLRWSIDGSDRDWAYTTTTQLAHRGKVWSVAWSPALLEPSLAPGERLVAQSVEAKRAGILGADGVALVTDRPVVRIGIDKTKIAAELAATSADSLASLVGVDPVAFAQRVTAAGPKAFVEALVVRSDGPNPPDSTKIASIPGAAQIPGSLPLAPTKEFARPILGTVGEATADLVSQSKGRLSAGDTAGLSGLQKSHDPQLRGRPGMVVYAAPPPGSDPTPRELFRRDPAPGLPVATTLEIALQTLAENLLAPVTSPSAIVAVRPSTGDVLAVASGPGGKGYSTAMVGHYAPGSSFKVVTALGLLRAGVAPDSVVPCTPTITVDGRSFKNYDDYPAGAVGEVPLRTAVANSCNTAMIAEGDKVSQEALSEAASGLGIGVERDLGVASFAGAVPVQAAKTDHAASMIGQGRVQVSPLAMAVVAASIARGEPVTPRLLVDGPANTAKTLRPLGPAEAEQLRELMRSVVTDGSGAFLGDVPGDPVMAKTGTAEFGEERPPRTHAWMIAIYGDLAVAVFVEDGASGSRTAGPILEQFLRGSR